MFALKWEISQKLESHSMNVTLLRNQSKAIEFVNSLEGVKESECAIARVGMEWNERKGEGGTKERKAKTRNTEQKPKIVSHE